MSGAVRPVDSPPSESLQNLLDGLAAYAVIAAVAAVLIGGIGWALGERLGFDGVSVAGRRSIVSGLALAFIIGFIAVFVQFLVGTGEANEAGVLPERSHVATPTPTPTETPPTEPVPPPTIVRALEVRDLAIEAVHSELQDKITVEEVGAELKKEISLDEPVFVVRSPEVDWILGVDVAGEMPPGHELFVVNLNEESRQFYPQSWIAGAREGRFRLPVRLGTPKCYHRHRPRIMMVVLVRTETAQYLRSHVGQGVDAAIASSQGWQVMGRIPVWKLAPGVDLNGKESLDDFRGRLWRAQNCK